MNQILYISFCRLRGLSDLLIKKKETEGKAREENSIEENIGFNGGGEVSGI
jgi:hypothetical protein